MTKCCFYGTLRKPEFNYIRFLNTYGDRGIHYIRTTVIKGYDLYDLGAYPAAVPIGDTIAANEREITVDLFEVNALCFDAVKRMEEGADYYEELVSIDDEFYSMFVMEEIQIVNGEKIQSGDWIKFGNNMKSYPGFGCV